MKLGKVMGFLPAKDFKHARSFFEDKLGLRFISEDPYALVMESNGTMIRIAKVQEFQPAPYTVLGWQVEDIVQSVTELRSRGVVFEKYPFVEDKELGIWTSPDGAKVAWFKDSDGNVLSVSQYP